MTKIFEYLVGTNKVSIFVPAINIEKEMIDITVVAILITLSVGGLILAIIDRKRLQRQGLI